MVVSMDLATYGGLCLALKRKGSDFERDVLWGGGIFPATQPPRALAFDAVLIAIRGRMLDKQAPGQSVFLAHCVCFGFRMISCLSFLWNVSFSYTCAVSMALRCWAVLRLLNDQQGQPVVESPCRAWAASAFLPWLLLLIEAKALGGFRTVVEFKRLHRGLASGHLLESHSCSLLLTLVPQWTWTCSRSTVVMVALTMMKLEKSSPLLSRYLCKVFFFFNAYFHLLERQGESESNSQSLPHSGSPLQCLQ